MQTLTSAEERQLLSGIKKAVDLVDNQGLSPNDAIVKVAQEHQWTRGAVRAAVSAYNNGRQVSQWRANDSVMDKMASFPLADYDAIYDEIWGQKKAAADAVSPEYSLPPTFVRNPEREKLLAFDLGQGQEKAAADGAIPEREEVTEHRQKRAMFLAWNEHNEARKAADESRTKYAAAHDRVRVYTQLLENYFKKWAMDRLPFATCEDVAATYWGSQGRAVFDMLAQSFPKEKRAADSRIFYDSPINQDVAPFTFVGKLIDAAKEVFHAKQAMDDAYAKLEKAAENLRPFVQTRPRSQPPDETSLISSEKMADFLGGAAIGMTTKDMIDKALSGARAKEETEGVLADLNDPEHENELRSIRAQAMLQGMMTDPDNPVSGYDPEEVLSRYNEISQLTPRLADQPAAVQPLLARRLAGQVQPFEVNEALNMEKGLRESNTPKGRSLLDAPDSLLG